MESVSWWGDYQIYEGLIDVGAGSLAKGISHVDVRMGRNVTSKKVATTMFEDCKEDIRTC